MRYSPMKIEGNWDEGWVLDNHVAHSEYIGEDAFGRAQYNTTRTELGEKLFQLKYRNNTQGLTDIVDSAVEFLKSREFFADMNVVICAPPSKDRIIQPAQIIAEEIAKRCRLPFSSDVLVKTSDIQSKSLDKENKNLIGTIQANRKATSPLHILVVDDLYSTGATLNECVRVLKDDPLFEKAYVLAITKTR